MTDYCTLGGSHLMAGSHSMGGSHLMTDYHTLAFRASIKSQNETESSIRAVREILAFLSKIDFFSSRRPPSKSRRSIYPQVRFARD